MSAAYDTYDYPSYWKGREYEHLSEVYALKSFLKEIPNATTALEIGAGHGRLVPLYLHKAKKLIVSDPSQQLLKLAKQSIKSPKVSFVHASNEVLKNKIKPKSIDLVVHVRVLHHIEDPAECINIIKKLLMPKGYLILEFANKQHFLANIREFVHGNFTYPIDISQKDLRSKKSLRGNTLPFYNFHPDKIYQLLETNGFALLQKRSVSNIRNNLLKKIIPTSVLIFVEKILQKPLASFNFGPSIFILAQKK